MRTRIAIAIASLTVGAAACSAGGSKRQAILSQGSPPTAELSSTTTDAPQTPAPTAPPSTSIATTTTQRPRPPGLDVPESDKQQANEDYGTPGSGVGPPRPDDRPMVSKQQAYESVKNQSSDHIDHRAEQDPNPTIKLARTRGQDMLVWAVTYHHLTCASAGLAPPNPDCTVAIWVLADTGHLYSEAAF